MTKTLFEKLPFRDTNNYTVERNHPVVVDTRELFSNADLWEDAKRKGEIVRVNGDYWWLTTAENAVKHGYNCYKVEGPYILNSFIVASRQTL